MQDDEYVLAEIERRCDNWKRCFRDIAPQASSSIQKVIDALIKKRGKPQDAEESQEKHETPLPKDYKDAEILEYVWVHLAGENDRTFWREKVIIRCSVFLSELPIWKLCQICKIKRQKDWPYLYRRAMLFFAGRIRVYEEATKKVEQLKKVF